MRELEASVRDLISRYVAASISVDELSDRLPDGWDLDEAGEPDATELLMRVVGYISEYQMGRRSESELRDALKGEASWLVERQFTTINQPVLTPDSETQARAGAGTKLREVLAS